MYVLICFTAILAIILIPLALHYRLIKPGKEFKVVGQTEFDWSDLDTNYSEVRSHYSILGILTNSITITLAVASIAANLLHRKRLIYIFGILIIFTSSVQVISSLITIIEIGNDYFWMPTIESQLKKSLQNYARSTSSLNGLVWQDMMEFGCCCGINGYSDFEYVGLDIPSVCRCVSINDTKHMSDHEHFYCPDSEPSNRRCYDVNENLYMEKGCIHSINDNFADQVQISRYVEVIALGAASFLHFVLSAIVVTMSPDCLKKEEGTDEDQTILVQSIYEEKCPEKRTEHQA